jgi:hypothetical protein
MNKSLRRLSALAFVLTTGSAAAQGLPTTQPNVISITREDVKVGRAADHAKVEVGWPAAYEKAKSPYYYLALISLTGPPEAWYIGGFESHAAVADSYKRESDDPVLAAELARLSRADSDFVNNVRIMQGRALRDLSYGAFPDIAKARFFEITWFRVRPGHELHFFAAAKTFAGAAKRANSNAAYRIYEIMAGTPGPTYLILSSVPSFADFDQMTADGDKTMKGFTAQEGQELQKFLAEGLVNTETQRFRVDPAQSYVPRETRMQDPAFWMPKKAAPAKPTTQPQ